MNQDLISRITHQGLADDLRNPEFTGKLNFMGAGKMDELDSWLIFCEYNEDIYDFLYDNQGDFDNDVSLLRQLGFDVPNENYD